MAPLLHVCLAWCILLTYALKRVRSFDVEQCFTSKSKRVRTCLFMSPFGTNDHDNPCNNEFISTPSPQMSHNRRLLGLSWPPLPNWPTKSPTDAPTPSPTNPSRSPTPSPTFAPTTSPTTSPTFHPTPTPTNNPTNAPTLSPTRNPTSSPTPNPTPAPTHNPTAHPTPAPTNNPTSSPTPSPTADPTDSPTNQPTSTPSDAPTTLPTQTPTNHPTLSPTPSPTADPTDSPTEQPTVAPSNAPTTGPSETPSNAPSLVPTNNPSSPPTKVPSLSPTIAPTLTPSTPPTNAPSLTPTLAPSSAPTSPPTTAPSFSPSKAPSIAPTLPPTRAPSLHPTSAPSTPPSNAPSLAPTYSPTMAPSAPTSPPSAAPSLHPTSSPTTPPTNAPSLAPTYSPTVAPTIPTASPSAAPSLNPTVAPTNPPTASPTRVPSLAPSVSPSVAPTKAPSLAPSDVPTFSPSLNPTIAPSNAPTLSPSMAPTLRPSRIPSPAPSLAPSGAPSAAPSGSPSQPPTLAPTYSPSGAPSESPSIAPSIAPTDAPSNTPSLSPSRSPSLAPSNTPSTPPTRSPSLAPSVSPSVAPTGAPTQPPSRVPSSPPTKSPTFPSCQSLQYVLEQAKDGDVIVIEDGVYNMSYGVDIHGLNNIIITGYNASVLVFDFHTHMLYNRSSFINIVDSRNITFQKMSFSGMYAAQDNVNGSNSLIYITNSSGIVFDVVTFEGFNVTNEEDIEDMVDGFALINIHHIYDYHVTRDTLANVYSVAFDDCVFIGNDLTNGFLIKSIAHSTNEETLSTGELAPIVLQMYRTYILSTTTWNDGGLVFGYNTIVHINESVFSNNRMFISDDHPTDEHKYPFCTICIVLEDDVILSYYINTRTDAKYTAQITSSFFYNHLHALNGGVLLIDAKVDTDSVLSIVNNTFRNNYVGVAGGVIHFTSYSSNAYYRNTSYCDEHICGTKLSIVNCTFKSNGISKYLSFGSTHFSLGDADEYYAAHAQSALQYKGGVVFINIEHDYTSSAHAFTSHVFHDSEVSIIGTSFTSNAVIAPSFDGGIIYFKYAYTDHRSAIDSVYRSWNILQITSSVFDGSDANINGSGGAIYIEHEQQSSHQGMTIVKHINISDSTFTHHRAIDGSAIYMRQLSWVHLNIEHSHFYNNTAYGGIGTLYINATDGMDITVQSCDFEDNTVHDGHGGALYLNVAPSSRVIEIEPVRRRSRNLLFASNMSTTAIITPSPSLSTTNFVTIKPTASPTETLTTCPIINITRCKFNNNSALRGYGAAIYMHRSDPQGCLTMAHHDTSFMNNKAMEGGAFYLNRAYAETPSTTDSINVLQFIETEFESNKAHGGSGGAIYIGVDTYAAEASCNDVTSFSVEITHCNITNSVSITHGAGVFVQCVDITMQHTIVSMNRITVDARYDGKHSKCVSSACLSSLALDFDEVYGGNGAGIYLYSSSMSVIDNVFSNNTINLGSGAALFHIGDRTTNYLKNQKSNAKMIIKGNLITNNHAIWNMTETDREPECTDFDGLSGFAGGFYIQLSIEYAAQNIAINNNTFIDNEALFVRHLYLDLLRRSSVDTLDMLYRNGGLNNTFINTTFAVGYAQATTPLHFSNVELLDGGVTAEVCDETDIGCIGYVLPGDSLFRVLFASEDYFGEVATPFIHCSLFKYDLTPNLVMKQIIIRRHEDSVLVEFEVSEAEYGTTEYMNISDTHQTFVSNLNNATFNTFHVITTLCSAGQEVDISTEGVAVCSNEDMKGVSFKCGKECGEQQYSFTRWEPECHTCPPYGVVCNGENIVQIEYAYYAKLRSSNKSISQDNPDDYVCSLEFDMLLCPAQLCCTNITGCWFNGYNLENMCATNRDPNVNFCGQCLDGFSEVYGSYECGECTHDQLHLLLIPIGVILLLEIYLIQRNPFVVTPLFTFVYKSLLYFYQILPILTYESYLSIVSGIINMFDLSIITSFTKLFNADGSHSGICLFANLTSYGKLWMNFITPGIFVIGLILIRLVIYLKDWCKARQTLKQYLLQFSYDLDELEYEPSYSSRQDGSAADMTLGLINNDALAIQDMSDIASRASSVDDPNAHHKGYQLIRKHLKQQKRFDPAQRVRDHYKDAVYNSLLIVYIVVCESTIKMFNCAALNDGKSYLWYSGNTACYDNMNYIFMALFGVLLLFPFYILYSLWKLRGSLAVWRRIKYPSFTMSYRRKCWYYEAVMMCRRIILISVYAFPKTNQYLLRAIIAFFCGIILTIHVKVLPFRYKINNNLETLLLLLLFLVSTLSTVSNTTGLGANLKYVTAVIAIIPLLFVPYLAFKYCRYRVLPKVKRLVASHPLSATNYSKLQTDDYNEYIAPHLQLNEHKKDEDDDMYQETFATSDRYIFIGDGGQIELAPFGQNKTQNNNDNDEKSWYNIIVNKAKSNPLFGRKVTAQPMDDDDDEDAYDEDDD
eukprot:829000_1